MSKLSSLKKDLSFIKSLRIKNLKLTSLFSIFLFANFIIISGLICVNGQINQPNTFTQGQQPSYSYLSNSTAFKQEIARMEINVVRQGKSPIPITRVPRLQKDDILKVRLLDEQVSGTKPDQSNWNWTFSVAYINPAINKEKEKVVSEEIQFKKTGWYKEYSLVVPYDSQPIFFLYSKPKYRDKILNLVSKNYSEISKIGEKSIELSDAYAKIGSFIDELQYVVNRNSYGSFGGYGVGYGSGYGNSYGSSYGGNSAYGSTYGGSYGSSYGGSYGSSFGTNQTLNRNFFMNQSVERLARSFNLQLPSCWQSGTGYSSYSNFGTNGTTSVPGEYYGVTPDFIGRSQCVAKSIKIEDFDISVSRMLQQGGILAASSLSIKYPQLSFWINIAAAAIDAINKIKRKSPLRIVPTISSTNENQAQGYDFQNNYSVPTAFSAGSSATSETVKISIFAESAPNADGFVTAYPLVLQKWQPNPDPEIISLPTPTLLEPCLHPGQNILRSTDLKTDWMADSFTRNFQLVMTSPNGFRKQFPLKKNIGLGGWELNLTKEDLNSFPKINLTLDSVITGNRGFNELQTPKFDIPVPNGGKWEIETESQKNFAVGGKRLITLKNLIGSCKCLQAVVYKPSFGGQFVFDNLSFSSDGTEVSVEVDTTSFQAGQGILELRQFGGEISNININLYPPPPNITDLKVSRGDNQAIVYGIGLDQVQALKINGKRAIAAGNFTNVSGASSGYVNPQGDNSAVNQSSAPYDSAFYSKPTEKMFVFEDPNTRLTTNSVSLEIELTGNRVYSYPKTFNVSQSRPAIIANELKEVEGVAITQSNEVNSNKSALGVNKSISQFNFDDSSIFSIDSAEISVNLQNALTDYDFKVENIEIETRIEKSQINPSELPKAKFEVLDWKNLRINFQLNDRFQKLLGGRRLQFRINDKERGNSDWYTLKKTFVRVPKILAIKCVSGLNGNCEMKGEGIDYISQISVDGGKSWYPEQPLTLIVQPTSDGKSAASIPHFTTKKLLQFKLRDFPLQPLNLLGN